LIWINRGPVPAVVGAPIDKLRRAARLVQGRRG